MVVNNGSTDRTQEVIEKYADRLPIRCVFEPKLGLSNARNRAVAEARGRLLLWTDDDVLVGRDWLKEYWASAQLHPECVFFGGAVKPWFEGVPPGWLARGLSEARGAYALVDPPSGPMFEGNSVLPVGANWGVRTEVQRGFAFDPELGRRGLSMIGGEEIVMMQRMMAAGFRGCWVPDAIVEHWIPRGRQTVGYLRSYFQGGGATSRRVSPDRTSRSLFGRPLWVWRQAFEYEVRYRVSRLYRPSVVWIKDLRHAAEAWGYLVGH